MDQVLRKKRADRGGDENGEMQINGGRSGFC